jgi:multidrug efflux system outer membrane protein
MGATAATAKQLRMNVVRALATSDGGAVLVARSGAGGALPTRGERRRIDVRLVAGAVAIVTLAGCAIGPDYRRPDIHAPEATRGQIGPVEAASLADLPWWEVFRDPVLKDLVEEAVRQNYDLRMATYRVEQARQLVGVARADLFPQIGYQANASRQRTFLFGEENGAVNALPDQPNQTFNVFLGTFNLAWELDIWGRIRRATESARAEQLGAEAFRRGVLLTLVSDVAQSYFELLALDRELDIARQSTDTFRATLELFTRQYEGGVGTRLEVSRGAAARAHAAAAIPDLQRAIVAKENQICILLGRSPGSIPRGAPLPAQPSPPDVPVGLPAQLLERRPDIRQAEEAVVAANANVGVAIGNFLPRLGLTSFYGGLSPEIENVVKGAGNFWAIAGSLTGPIFQGGRLISNYHAAQAAWEASVQNYAASAVNAFAEVSNAIVSQDKLKGIRAEKELEVTALEESVQMSLERYDEGTATYFEVLEAQQQLFPAQIELVRTMRDQLTIVVLLYRALGGGWLLGDDEWAPGVATAAATGVSTP